MPLESRTAPSLLIRRTFPPGSEWLYAKLFTGTATVDRVLCEDVAPLAQEAIASGAARRWFFIRYSEGGWHLRLRFQGDPRVLRERVQPALESMAQRLIDTVGSPAVGEQLAVQLDGCPVETWRVVYAADRVSDVLSHVQLFLETV